MIATKNANLEMPKHQRHRCVETVSDAEDLKVIGLGLSNRLLALKVAET
jgi:hypothetical protein